MSRAMSRNNALRSDVPGGAIPPAGVVDVFGWILFVFFKFQFDEFIGEGDGEGAVGHLPETVQCKILACYCCGLIYVVSKGIRRSKSDTAFFVPDLLAKSKIIAGKGGVSSLYFIAGRIEIAEEFQDQGAADLVSGIDIRPVVEAGDGLSAQAARSDITVKKGKIAAEIQLRSHGDRSIDIQPIVILRPDIHLFTDGHIRVSRIADHIAGIISDIGLYVWVGSMIEEAYFEGH